MTPFTRLFRLLFRKRHATNLERKRLRGVQAQMTFWHAEEVRLTRDVEAAYRAGNVGNHRQAVEKLRIARLRRKNEVTDKIETL